jgi:hypothetical protein
MVLPISALSNRIIRMAFAPIALAFCTSRSSAWRRASSSICVYSWISPPTIDRSPAMRLPPRPLLRTTTPKHCPSIRTVRCPVTFSVVTIINCPSYFLYFPSRTDPIMHPGLRDSDQRSVISLTGAQNRLRAKTNFTSCFNLICPVQSCRQKDSALLQPQISGFLAPSRTRKRGASRSSRTLGAGCDGRDIAADECWYRGRRSRVVLAPRRWR